MEFLQEPSLIWFAIGMVLFIVELNFPGVLFMFFGMGAWLTSFVCLIFGIGIDTQLILFALSSVLFLILLRHRFRDKFLRRMRENPETLDDEFLNKTGIAVVDFDEEHEGKIEFRGTTWEAKSAFPIKKGEKVIILDKESIKLIVAPGD